MYALYVKRYFISWYGVVEIIACDHSKQNNWITRKREILPQKWSSPFFAVTVKHLNCFRAHIRYSNHHRLHSAMIQSSVSHDLQCLQIYQELKERIQLYLHMSDFWDLLLYCTVLYCTALYCTVLYCTVLTSVLTRRNHRIIGSDIDFFSIFMKFYECSVLQEFLCPL